MEVEERLLSAIDELAGDGTAGEVRLLVALLSCRGKVEMRELGWQHPFRDFAEAEGRTLDQSLQGLIRRGLVYRTRQGAMVLNSQIMTHNKDFVTTRCANRLFARAHAKFASVLKEIPFETLRDMSRLRSQTAVNRAHRNMGGRLYQQLRRAGLVVSSERANPGVFPTLRWVGEVPRVMAVAITLEAGNALSWKNVNNECGIAFHVALATGCLAYDSEKQELRITDLGRNLGQAYIASALNRRFYWLSGCREETMHLILDELSAPLPSVWVDGSPSKVNKTWNFNPATPLRILFKDQRLRVWLRRMVRRYQKLGVAQLIACSDGANRYYFAPTAAQVAKDSLDLPAERFALPAEMQDRVSACHYLLSRIGQEKDGLWRLRPDPVGQGLSSEVTKLVESTIGKLRWHHQVGNPAADGAYRVSDPDSYRWMVMELLLDPVTEFLATLPEEELDGQSASMTR